MNRDKEFPYSTAVKQQYLPPPLEQNYLSLLDIQVKAAKELLHGTEQEKISIIKKRIKKFFDYGNDDSKNSDINFQTQSNKKSQYPPFQSNKHFSQGLEIDSSQLILYGNETVNLQIAQKVLPGFIGTQKIDDCNIKMTKITQKSCQRQRVRSDRKNQISQLNTQKYIKKEWFQLEIDCQDNKEVVPGIFARYVTNKDDILFQNDHYFRKLLGKARQIIDKKEKQKQEREEELKRRLERKEFYKKRKIFEVKKYNDMDFSRDFDKMTNYDGVYAERSNQKFENSRQQGFFDSREEPWYYGGRQIQQNKRIFDRLEISSIRSNKNYQNGHHKDQFKRQRHRQTSAESINCFESYHKKRRPQKMQANKKEIRNQDQRQRLIMDHRQKSVGKNLREPFEGYDYDKEIAKKIAREKKPIVEIDY